MFNKGPLLSRRDQAEQQEVKGNRKGLESKKSIRCRNSVWKLPGKHQELNKCPLPRRGARSVGRTSRGHKGRGETRECQEGYRDISGT